MGQSTDVRRHEPEHGRRMSNDTFQQISLDVAETYEAAFVPVLFAGLAPHLLDIAGAGPGHQVLDVACGTGIVARTAVDRVGPSGRVAGLDLNEAMLTVARRLAPGIEWRQGDAAALPFGDGEFDVAVCQSGLMFVPDVAAVLREMARVAAGGTVAVQVWSAPERQDGFRPFAEVVTRHAGPDAVDLLSTYFRLGDPDAFTALCAAAGLRVTDVRTLPVTPRAPSVDAYVTAEVESTPLVARITEETYQKIRVDARTALAPFCDDAGELAMPMEVYLVRAESTS
jgi:ubiquinone/menaquinone biosynthesis C-methylase UbiE